MIQINWYDDRPNRVSFGYVEDTNYIFFIDTAMIDTPTGRKRQVRRLTLHQDVNHDKHPKQVPGDFGLFTSVTKAKQYANAYLQDHMVDFIRLGTNPAPAPPDPTPTPDPA